MRKRGQGWPKQLSKGEVTVLLPRTRQTTGNKTKIEGLSKVSLRWLLAVQMDMSSGQWSHGS